MIGQTTIPIKGESGSVHGFRMAPWHPSTARILISEAESTCKVLSNKSKCVIDYGIWTRRREHWQTVRLLAGEHSVPQESPVVCQSAGVRRFCKQRLEAERLRCKFCTARGLWAASACGAGHFEGYHMIPDFTLSRPVEVQWVLERPLFIEGPLPIFQDALGTLRTL